MAIRIGTAAIAALMLGTAPVTKVFLGTTQIWANEVVVVLGAVTDVVMESLFTSEQWADAHLKKRVVAPPGIEIGATGSAYAIRVMEPGADMEESWAGQLTLEVLGTVSGIGGAPNSGMGGHALDANFTGRNGEKLKITGSGLIRAGGGGGGRGGNGGNGSYNFREPASGWRYTSTSNNTFIVNDRHNQRLAYWGSTLAGTASGTSPGSFASGGWTYLRGSLMATTSDGPEHSRYHYQIARQQTRSSTGGTGGNGARGQGFDGPAGTGADGGAASAAGAGPGGKGGNGGPWGSSGATGATGTNGNVTNGTAGAAGGLPGAWLNGAANADFTNFTGTHLGRLI